MNLITRGVYFALAVVLGACAVDPQPVVLKFRRVDGGDRSQATLERDIAACRYEVARTQAGAPAPRWYAPSPAIAALGSAELARVRGAELVEMCMSARGWRFEGGE